MTVSRGRSIWPIVALVVLGLIVIGAVVNVVIGAILMLTRLVLLVAALGVVAWLYTRRRRNAAERPERPYVASTATVVPGTTPTRGPDPSIEQELEALKRTQDNPQA